MYIIVGTGGQDKVRHAHTALHIPHCTYRTTHAHAHVRRVSVNQSKARLVNEMEARSFRVLGPRFLV